jgi:hypothetical protein
MDIGTLYNVDAVFPKQINQGCDPLPIFICVVIGWPGRNGKFHA